MRNHLKNKLHYLCSKYKISIYQDSTPVYQGNQFHKQLLRDRKQFEENNMITYKYYLVNFLTSCWSRHLNKKYDEEFKISMNRELYPNLLERTQQEFRDNYLLKTKNFVKEKYLLIKETSHNLNGLRHQGQMGLTSLSNQAKKSLSLNESIDKEQIIKMLQDEGNKDEQQIQESVQKLLEEQETVQRSKSALRDLKKEYSQRAVSFMQMYHESLQQLVEGQREVIHNKNFEFEDKTTVKDRVDRFEARLKKIMSRYLLQHKFGGNDKDYKNK